MMTMMMHVSSKTFVAYAAAVQRKCAKELLKCICAFLFFCEDFPSPF